MRSKIKILLTGGSGFIGKNILEQLGAKYEFIAPRSTELNLENPEAVFEYLQNNKFQLVIHAGNKGGTRKDLDLADVCFKNLLMFFNLLAGKKYFDRMIVLGSGAEYNKKRDMKNISENDFGFPTPTDQYGFSKYIMAKYAQNVNFITHLRLFGIFGKYEDYEIKFISNSICKALFDLPITIKQNVYFDYIYINDLVDIIDAFSEKPPKEIHYNVGNGQPVDLLTIAKMILKITGKNLPIQIAQQGLNNEYTCDITRLKEEFPEIKYTALEEAIKDLVKYYESIVPNLDKRLFSDNIFDKL